MQYADDDYVYDEDIPDFHDENELDEYLNDEEYDLMMQIFPQVKEAMEEYQNWNNLDLKLAIFDCEFDTDAALDELKSKFKKQKKKKPTKGLESTPDSAVLSTTQSLQQLNINTQSKMDPDDMDWLEDSDSDDERNREPKRITYQKATKPTKPRTPVNLSEYLTQTKPNLSFVVLGHVDAGKSTLMGRLLYDIGAVETNQIRKLKKESERIGKGSFHLAWVMDQTNEERERGVTVSICTSEFKTDKANFTIVDAPGHRDFVPNAIMGVSQADVAILSVDCGTNAFESGFHLDGQTKEHTLLARSMDISNIIVAMNKMDTVNWSQERFEFIKAQLSDYLTTIGFQQEQVEWVPLSGFSGEGVYKIPYPSQQDWYKGKSLVETLENVAYSIDSQETRNKIVNQPFIMSILDVTPSKKNDETTISGKIESGSIQPGESLTIYPSEQSCLVDKIIKGREQTNTNIGVKNEFVTIKLRNSFTNDIHNGDLATSIEYDVQSTRNIIVKLKTFQMTRPLLPGTSVMLFRGVYQEPAYISKLIELVNDDDSTKKNKKKIRHLSSNQTAIVEIELIDKRTWLPMLTVSENKHIGHIILRKDGRTIASGTIEEIH